MTDLPIVTLAGPISGLPNGNLQAFREAEDRLRGEGWDVRNPRSHELSGDALAEAERLGDRYRSGSCYKAMMRITLQNVLQSQAVVVLEGWHASFGASLEVNVARASDVPVYDLDGMVVHDFDGWVLA